MNPYATFDQIVAARRPDPLTSKLPRFTREITCFDRPTTFNLTVEENREQNRKTYLRNAR